MHEGGVTVHDAPNKAEEKELLDWKKFFLILEVIWILTTYPSENNEKSIFEIRVGIVSVVGASSGSHAHKKNDSSHIFSSDSQRTSD